MPKPYHRRAFVLLALAALEPASAAPARADGETLWDLLAKNSSPPAPIAPILGEGASAPASPSRLALGPIPGFTLPAPDPGSAAPDKPKSRRHSILGSFGDMIGRLSARTGTKVDVRGQSVFSFRSDSVSGGQDAVDAYRSDRYLGRGSGGVYNDTDLTVDAQLFKYFHYRTQYSNRYGQNPNNNRVKLDYDTKNVRFEWGDINAGFRGNSLIDFNRYTSGMQLTNQWSKNFRTSLMYSVTKAETRTITLQGQDKSGPYYVFSGQIVEGSAHVRVDNRELEQGKDFTLDPYSGVLNFTNSTIIPQTSTIAISYEAQSYNQQRGSIMGMRTEFAPRPGLNIGLTYLAQNAQGSTGLQYRPQEFYGNGTAGDVYSLADPVDTTRPVTVTINGVALVQNVDYVVDPTYRNQIRINQAIPSTTIVRVEYIPLNNTPTPGNRSVLGLDGTLGLGKFGTISLEMARSGLSVSGDNISGSAWQVRSNLTPFRRLNTSITLKSVSPSFSSIQTPGFNRSEKSLDVTSDYTVSDRLRFNVNWQKAKRPAYSIGSLGGQFTVNSIGNDDYTQYSVGSSYNFTKSGSLSLTRSNLSTTFIAGGFSTNSSDTLALNYGLSDVNLDASLSRTRSLTQSNYNLTAGALGGVTTTGATALYASDTSTLSKHVGLHWNPKKLAWLTLGATHSQNDIHNNGAGNVNSATARDTDLSASLSLFGGMHLTYSYSLSDTGNVVPRTTDTTTTGTGSTAATGSTGTTGTTGSTTVVGGAPTGARGATRDITVGGATNAGSTGTSSLGIGSLGSVYGGGANLGLGSYGAYSGYYGDGLNSSYTVANFGGHSRTHRVGLDYQVPQRLHLGALHFSLNFDNSISDDYNLYNSTRNGMNFSASWDPSDRMHMDATYGKQNVAYSGAVGATSSNTFGINLFGRPFGGRLTTQFGWQTVRTQSALNLVAGTVSTGATSTVPTGTTGTTAATSSLTDTSNAINTYNFKVEYPISRLFAPFFEMQRSNVSGYLGNTDDNFRFGVDYSLTRELKLALGWQVFSHQYRDTANAKYNYKASSLIAELGVRF